MRRFTGYIRSFIDFYITGFREMPSWALRVWLIIAIKVIVIFLILKLIFFPNFLNSKFNTDEEKGDYVIEQITR